MTSTYSRDARPSTVPGVSFDEVTTLDFPREVPRDIGYISLTKYKPQDAELKALLEQEFGSYSRYRQRVVGVIRRVDGYQGCFWQNQKRQELFSCEGMEGLLSIAYSPDSQRGVYQAKDINLRLAVDDFFVKHGMLKKKERELDRDVSGSILLDKKSSAELILRLMDVNESLNDLYITVQAMQGIPYSFCAIDTEFSIQPTASERRNDRQRTLRRLEEIMIAEEVGAATMDLGDDEQGLLPTLTVDDVVAAFNTVRSVHSLQ